MAENVDLPKGFQVVGSDLPEGFQLSKESLTDEDEAEIQKDANIRIAQLQADLDRLNLPREAAQDLSIPLGKGLGSIPLGGLGPFFADLGAEISKLPWQAARMHGNPVGQMRVENIEAQQEQLRSVEPSAVFGGQVGAPMATMPLGGPVAKLAPKVGIPAFAAFEGAAFAPSDWNPLVAAGVNTVMPKLFEGLMKRGRKAVQSFLKGDPTNTVDAQKQVANIIRDYYENSGMTPEEVLRKVDELGPESVLADIPEFRGLSQATAMTPSGRTFQEALEARQLGAQERLMSKVFDLTGKTGDEFKGSLKNLIDTRRANAKPLYDQVRETPVELSEEMFKRLNADKNFKDVAKLIKRETGEKLDLENLTIGVMDQVKQSIDDKIGRAITKGARNEAKSLLNLKNDLVDMLDEIDPDYALARSQFAGDIAIESAMDVGRNIFKREIKKDAVKMDFDDLKEYADSLTPTEFDAFQRGAVKSMNDLIENVPETADAAAKFWKKPGIRNRVALAFKNPDDFDSFLKNLQKESNFTNTLRELYQGSQTAFRVAAKDALDPGVSQRLSEKVISGIRKREFKPEAIQELSRLMFDKNTPINEIKDYMHKAGIVPRGLKHKTFEAIRKNWDEIYVSLMTGPGAPIVTAQATPEIVPEAVPEMIESAKNMLKNEEQ